MAKEATLDISTVRVERGHPEEFVALFPELQDLRQEYYEWSCQPTSVANNAAAPTGDIASELPTPEPTLARTPREIAHFVASYTADKWCDPTLTAREGLFRYDPQVTVAFDRATEEIKAYSYAAQEASSRFEVAMLNRHSPEVLARWVGELERHIKISYDMQTVWTSETVYLPGQDELGMLTKSGNLSYYDGALEGSVYPYEEEGVLKRFIARLGFKPTEARVFFAALRHTPPKLLATNPEKGKFGPGSRDTTSQRWSISAIGRIPLLVEHIVGEDTMEAFYEQLAAFPTSPTKHLTFPAHYITL